jgi:diguanylate cyclase (GGDEF)-like protein
MMTTAVISLFLAFMVLSVRISILNQVRGMRTWATATFLMATAGIFLSLQGLIPELLSVVVGNALMVTATNFYWVALRRYNECPTPNHWPIVLGLSTAVWVVYFRYVEDSRSLHMYLALALVLLNSVMAAFEAGRCKHARINHHVIMASFVGVALATLLRMVSLVVGSSEAQNFFTNSLMTGMFSVVVAAMNVAMTIGFILMVSDRVRTHLNFLATHDPLTGVLTRREYFKLAQREIQRMRRLGGHLSLILLDIDNFKQINDTYGHPCGDAVLNKFAWRVQPALRVIDLMGRYGGEEFILILPDTPIAAAQKVADRVRQIVEAMPVDTPKGPISLTISLGVASTSNGQRGLESLMASADRALYRAKNEGRNRVVVSDDPDSSDLKGESVWLETTGQMPGMI